MMQFLARKTERMELPISEWERRGRASFLLWEKGKIMSSVLEVFCLTD